MTDFIAQILTSAAVNIVLSGLLLWVTKSWISERLQQSIRNEYNQKLETHKAQLKAQADVELEKLHSQLSIYAAEHQTLFSHLHEQRAQVVAKTYALLKSLHYAFSGYVNIARPVGDAPMEQYRQKAANAYTTFRQYYAENLIFIPKDVAKKLEDIDLELVKTFHEFLFTIDMQEQIDAKGDAKWVEIFNRVNIDFKTTFAELEDEFRKLIGDGTSQ